VPLVHALPAVGRNLQDHLCVSFYVKANRPTLRDEMGTLLGKMKIGLRYLLTKRGPLAMSVNQAGGFLRGAADAHGLQALRIVDASVFPNITSDARRSPADARRVHGPRNTALATGAKYAFGFPESPRESARSVSRAVRGQGFVRLVLKACLNEGPDIWNVHASPQERPPGSGVRRLPGSFKRRSPFLAIRRAGSPPG